MAVAPASVLVAVFLVVVRAVVVPLFYFVAIQFPLFYYNYGIISVIVVGCTRLRRTPFLPLRILPTSSGRLRDF